MVSFINILHAIMSFVSSMTSYATRLRFVYLVSSLALTSISLTYASLAGMPPMSAQEYAEFEKFIQDLEKPEMQQFIKEFEQEFNKLPPEVQKQLNDQAMEDLRRMGIDPFTYQPAPLPSSPPQPLPQKPQPISQPNHTKIDETPADCSQVTCHSTQQASALLQSTISHLEIIRHKLTLIHVDTNLIQEWLNALTYYLKMMNKPEHIRRLISVTFTHLFDLISDLETVLRTESSSLIVLTGEEASNSDDPYAILGIAYHASNEEIKKAYEQKMSAQDPASLQTLLEQAQVDPIKIKKRVRQASLQQATLTDAYDRLNNVNLRQQIDHYREHTQKQQLTLREANIQSIERLRDTLTTLVQQGIIQELEDFFARYAPTELSYHQHMEEAEKNRFAEQRNNVATAPISSPLGGGSGYPFNNYQPHNYFPNNSYFPPHYQPSFNQHSNEKGGGAPLTPGGSSNGNSDTAKPPVKPSDSADKKGKDKDKDKDPKKESAKKQPREDEKKEKKKKEDPFAAVKKEFTKQLDSLKEPLSNFKKYLEDESQTEVRTKLMELEQPAMRGTSRNITDNTFASLREALRKHTPLSFIEKLDSIRKFISAIMIPAKGGVDACRPIWEAHHKTHQVAYAAFKTIYKHLETALKSNPKLAETVPWNNIINACSTLTALQELFKKKQPGQEATAQQQKFPLLKPNKKESEKQPLQQKPPTTPKTPVQQLDNYMNDFKERINLIQQKLNEEETKKFIASLKILTKEKDESSTIETLEEALEKLETLLNNIGVNKARALEQAIAQLLNKNEDLNDKEEIKQRLKELKKDTYPDLLKFHKKLASKLLEARLRLNKAPVNLEKP